MPRDPASDSLADIRSPENTGRRLDRVLLRLVDGGLAGCVFVVPFLMGGRQALGQLTLVTLAVVVAVAWLLRQCTRAQATWRWSAGELVFLAGVGLLLAQLAPWPPSLQAWLSPNVAQLLPLWTDGADASIRLGEWRQVSLTPSATRDGLVLFLAYALLFATAVQRIRAIEDVERLLRWCAVSALLMGTFGLVQFVTSNGKFFWVFEHPFSSTSDVAKGSFTNRNHFAHFLALGMGPLLWWIQHRLRKSHQRRGGQFAGHGSALPAFELGASLRVVGLGIVLFAGLLSLSRGGMLVMLIAGAISVAVCYRASSLGLRFVAGLGAAALLIGVALAVFGYDRVVNRVDDLTSGSLEELDVNAGRRTIWEATLKSIPAYLPLGAGVGSLQQVYPMHVATRDDWLYYTHAENGPLQVTLETGLAGLAVTILAILLCAFWCIAGLRNAASRRVLVCAGAVSAALAANLVHSLFDFVWYVPGCMVLVTLLAACACRLRQMRDGKSADRAGQFHLPRAVVLVAATAVLVLGLWMVQGRVGPVAAEQAWLQYLRIARTPVEPDFNGENATPRPAQDSPVACPSGLCRSGATAGLPSSAGNSVVQANRDLRQSRMEGSVLLRPDPGQPLRGEGPAITAISRRVQNDRTAAACSPATNGGAGAATSPETVAQLLERSLESRERKMIAALEEVLRWEPDHLEAHLRLAESYLALFDRRQQTSANQMPLCAVCDAVMKEQFASRDLMDQWLARAVGENRACLDSAAHHAREALSLCPLVGDGYLCLSDLCFLEGGTTATRTAYVRQSLLVRPNDGKVLFHAGRQAALAGDFEQCLTLWRRAFQAGKVYQQQIIEGLAGRIRPENPQEEIQVFLEAFRPELYGLRLLNAIYSKSVAPDLLVGLRWSCVQAIEAQAAQSQNKTAAELWLEALTIYRQLNEEERAAQCGIQGLACDPNHYWLHFELARSLTALEQFARAEEMLRWCAARKPDDQRLERLLYEVVKRRIDREGRVDLTARRSNVGPLR